jgi:hypothetical protein
MKLSEGPAQNCKTFTAGSSSLVASARWEKSESRLANRPAISRDNVD